MLLAAPFFATRVESHGSQCLKILLIEDEADFASQIKSMLEQAKGAVFELVSADHLDAGLARLADGGFDLVLIDLTLPDGAGLANIARSRRRRSACRSSCWGMWMMKLWPSRRCMKGRRITWSKAS